MSSSDPVKRLIQELTLEKQDISRLIILTLGIGVLNLAIPIAVQALVNIVTMGSLIEPLLIVSFILFLILCLLGGFYLFEKYLVELIQRRVFVRTALSAAESAKSSKLDAHDQQNTVELMNRFFDVITVQKSGAVLLTSGLVAVLQAIVGSIALTFYSLYFGLVIILIIMSLLIVANVIGNNAKYTAIQESKSKYEIAAWIEALARNVSTFKFSKGAYLALSHANSLATSYLEKRRKHFKTLFKQTLGGVLIYALAGTSMLALGGSLVIKGQMNLGQFVAAELIIFSVLASVRKCIDQLEYYYDLIAAFDKISMIDDIPREECSSNSISLSNGLNLTIKDLSFSFIPSRPVLSNISFSLYSGEKIVVHGASGSGKSTLAELIAGLRLPQAGTIYINEIDYRQLDFSDVRQYIGFAGSTELIEDSVLENIRLGRTDINIERVIAVLDSVGLRNDIDRLEDGLNTLLNHNGAPLSSVQSQLLMIVRALINEPKLLIIDGLLDGFDLPIQKRVISTLQSYPNMSLVLFTRKEAIAQEFTRVIEMQAFKEEK